MPVGVVSAVRLSVGPIHNTSNSTSLILSSFSEIVQVSMMADPVKMEEEDDTITVEGARTMAEIGYMQYNIIRASIASPSIQLYHLYSFIIYTASPSILLHHLYSFTIYTASPSTKIHYYRVSPSVELHHL